MHDYLWHKYWLLSSKQLVLNLLIFNGLLRKFSLLEVSHKLTKWCDFYNLCVTNFYFWDVLYVVYVEIVICIVNCMGKFICILKVCPHTNYIGIKYPFHKVDVLLCMRCNVLWINWSGKWFDSWKWILIILVVKWKCGYLLL